MQGTDRLFAGSIPELYDRYLGPLIFEPYARDLAARLAVLQPAHILETAAGTGVATRALARALPSSVTIVATDLNQPMLDYAASHTDADNVTRRQADALKLPFGDGAFDAVACQFGAMFFPDKVDAYREAWRVLQPSGRFLFNVWDRIEHNELAQIVTEAVASLLVGGFDAVGDLIYCGRITSGLGDRARRTLYAELASTRRDRSPFRTSPDVTNDDGVRWVDPVIVVRVEYREFTGLLRHAAFKGVEVADPLDAVVPPAL